jgi:hypothetical protein
MPKTAADLPMRWATERFAISASYSNCKSASFSGLIVSPALAMT